MPRSSTFNSSESAGRDLKGFTAWASAALRRISPLLIVFIAIVWFGHRQPPQRLEDRVAEALLAGREFPGLTGWDARLIWRRYIAGSHERKDIVVLASSRGFAIRGTLFPGQTFFNNSVSGGTLEDDIGIYAMYEKAGLIPKTLILDIEPWMFKRTNTVMHDLGVVPWASIAPEIDRGLRLLSPWQAPLQWSQRRFESPAWLDLGIVKRSALGLAPVTATQPAPSIWLPVTYTYKLDGAAVGVGSFPTAAQVDYAAAHFDLIAQPFFWDQWTEIEPERLRLLKSFLQAAASRGVAVRLLLVPYHPATWHIFQTNPRYRGLPAMEAAVVALARQQGLPLYGSFDPGRCGMTNHDFLDPVHMNEPGMARLLAGCLRHSQ